MNSIVLVNSTIYVTISWTQSTNLWLQHNCEQYRKYEQYCAPQVQTFRFDTTCCAVKVSFVVVLYHLCPNAESMRSKYLHKHKGQKNFTWFDKKTCAHGCKRE